MFLIKTSLIERFLKKCWLFIVSANTNSFIFNLGKLKEIFNSAKIYTMFSIGATFEKIVKPKTLFSR